MEEEQEGQEREGGKRGAVSFLAPFPPAGTSTHVYNAGVDSGLSSAAAVPHRRNRTHPSPEWIQMSPRCWALWKCGRRPSVVEGAAVVVAPRKPRMEEIVMLQYLQTREEEFRQGQVPQMRWGREVHVPKLMDGSEAESNNSPRRRSIMCNNGDAAEGRRAGMSWQRKYVRLIVCRPAGALHSCPAALPSPRRARARP